MAQFWTDSTLLMALQADLATVSTLADNEYVALLCDTPKISFATEVTELELTTGQVGAAPEKIVGRRSGTMQVSMPLQGFKTGYDPTAENPGGAPVGAVDVIPPWLALAGNALGCNAEALAGATLSDKNTNFWRGTFLSNSGYGAGKVTAAGTDTTHLQGDGGEGAGHKAGQLIAAALSGVIAPFVGFIKTKLVDLMTIFDAAQAPTANYDDNAANVYGTSTAWQSDDQPRALTARWIGPDTKMCYIFTGLTCESWKLSLEPGATPTIEFSFRFYDFSMDKTKGGLIVPDSYQRSPQLVGNKTGIAMLDNTHKCGLEGLTVEWKASVRETKCHAGPQGISAIAIVKPRVTVSFTVAHDVSDVVYNDAGVAGNTGSHVWQASLEQGSTHSLGVYVGPNVGKCLGILIPAGRVSAVPSIADKDGVQAYSVTLEASSYTGDSTDTAETTADSPIDSIVRIALA